MIDELTTRSSLKDWKSELNKSMRAAGIKRKDELYERLEEGLKLLVNLINEFSGLDAKLIYPAYRDEFHVGLMVKAYGQNDHFHAYITCDTIEDKSLDVEINYSERPSTEEFPLENGSKWRVEKLNESEVKDPLFIVAYVKNCFIKYESFRRIGNRIIYSILEE
jgi:hypothetical protein